MTCYYWLLSYKSAHLKYQTHLDEVAAHKINEEKRALKN